MVLVFKRKAGEQVMIGETVRLLVVEIKGQTVRLAIDAPPDVRIDRGEVRERKNAEPARCGPES